MLIASWFSPRPPVYGPLWLQERMSLMPTPEEAVYFVGGALTSATAAFGLVRARAKRHPEGS